MDACFNLRIRDLALCQPIRLRLYLAIVHQRHFEPGKVALASLIVRYSNNGNKCMAAHAGVRWFYENMVDSGQYQLVETIIGFRGCRRLHRDKEFPLGRN